MDFLSIDSQRGFAIEHDAIHQRFTVSNYKV
jgi:hypothetical protein